MAMKSVEHIRPRHTRPNAGPVAKAGRRPWARTMEDDMEQKFTQMAQEVLSDAVQNAAALGNPQVDTLHLLDAMLRQENSMARALIEAAGGNAQNVSAEVHQAMQSLPSARLDVPTHNAAGRQQAAVGGAITSRKRNATEGRRVRHRRPHAGRNRGREPDQSADILEKNGLTAEQAA